MAVGPYAWSTTAASNGSADTNVNFAENQTPASLNNSARALMAGLAGWLDSIGGAGTNGGSSNAYTYTNPAVAAWASLADGNLVCIKANHTNSGAATLAVDGLEAKPIRKSASTALNAGDLVSGARYLLAYDLSGDYFQILSSGGFVQPRDATIDALAALSYTSGTLLIRETAADTFELASDALYAHLAEAETFSGAKTFSTAVTISTNSGALPSPTSGTLLHTGGADSATPRWFIDGFAATPTWEARRANGTNASKSALSSGDNLLNIQVTGYGATGYSAAARGAIRMTASQNWTDSAHGTRGSLHSASNDTTTLSERYRWGDTTSTLELGYRDGGPGSEKTADYTFALTDRGTPTDHNHGSAHAFTVPPNSSVPFPANAVLYGTNWGAGALTLTRGDGVTFRDETGADANLTIAQYESYMARRHPSSADVWTVRVV
jgi:hypothetical protein